MKKVVTWVLSVAMIMGLCVPAMAVSGSAGAEAARTEMLQTFDELCVKYNQDEELAMAELLSIYPSLEIVDASMKYFDDEGNAVLPTKSNMTDISLVGDKLVYDNDWGTYVYFGYWKWKNGPDEANKNPYDVVGFYTQSASEMYPLEYFVYGQNSAGVQKAYYNSESGESSGYISKGEDTTWGAAFWIDDRYVVQGRIVVPIDYTAGSNKKVMIKYGHSWTTSDITGVGGSVSIDGGGFDISWETNVNHWESPVTSAGVRLP